MSTEVFDRRATIAYTQALHQRGITQTRFRVAEGILGLGHS